MVDLLVDEARDKVRSIYESNLSDGLLKPHKERVEEDIRKSGASFYDMLLPETRTLPYIIEPKENILGSIYGHYQQTGMQDSSMGRGVFVATDKRVLLVDHKPLFMKCIEYPYSVVSAISYSKAASIISVTLYTRIGNLSIQTVSKKMALQLIAAVHRKLINDGPSNTNSAAA